MKTSCYAIIHRIVTSLVLTSLLAFGEAEHASAGTIIYVRAAATGLHDGTSWANAYVGLQKALSVAVSGQQIWVAKGTYKPTTGTSRSTSFVLKPGVAIYGGFAGTETLLGQRQWSANATVLSGDIGVVGSKSDNSYQVVAAGGVPSTSILDGFTITGGNANGSTPYDSGGGLYTADGSPTLRNLTLSSNSAYYGGGVYAGSGSPTLTNVTFIGNSAGDRGGGLVAVNARLTNTTFIGNSAAQYGGAMYGCGFEGLTNVTFEANSAYSGGAIRCDGGYPTLSNVTFAGNTARTGYGGAMSLSGSDATLTNVTFSGNSAMNGSAIDDEGNLGTEVLSISNSIIAATDNIYSDGSAAVKIGHSVMQGGCPPVALVTCTNIITADPKLGPLQNNGGLTKTMALGAGSSAIDAINCSSAPKADQRGVARPQGTACDIGAYEVRVGSFSSAAAYDGEVPESGKATNIGGLPNTTSTTLRVGDDALGRRYRSVLSFDTSALKGKTAIGAQLRVLKQSMLGNPFGTQGSLIADLSAPYFGTQLALVNSDFQVTPLLPSAAKPFAALPTGWYRGILTPAAVARINTYGTTQFRLRFTTETYNAIADNVAFYSGNAVTVAYRPVLWVYYNP